MASTGFWRNLGSMVHLLGHPCPGVPFLFAGVGVEVAGALGAMLSERDHPDQKCRGGRRPTEASVGAFTPSAAVIASAKLSSNAAAANAHQ